MAMTDLEKAKWLKKNYRDYALEWYLSDHARLSAIFRKEYDKYLSSLNNQIVEEQQSQINQIEERMFKAYKEVYGSDYLVDTLIDRRGTFERVQEIRELWFPAPAH
jgi:hypothetical protein